MRHDLFVLILGYGRTGTSLCAGLIDASPGFVVGYELNNGLLTVNHADDVEEEATIRFLEDGGNTKLSRDYNGNKIVINSGTNMNLFFYLLKNNSGFMHQRFKDLKVIFTKRDPISTLVSRKKRVIHKGIDLSVDVLVKDYLISMSSLSLIKSFVKTIKGVDFYVFDFDETIANPIFHAQKMFEYLGEPFDSRFVHEYKGSHNYSHAVGVGKQNVMYGYEGRFPRLREKLQKELDYKRAEWEM